MHQGEVMTSSVVPYNHYEALNAYQRLRSSLSQDSADSALAEIKTFLKMFPDVALAHNDLGVLYHQVGDSLLALAHYEKANRLQPNNPTVIKNLAEFYFVVLKWTDDAIAMLTSLLQSYPDDFEILTALGTISSQVGQFDEARVFYRKALQNDPDNQTLRSMLAELDGPVSAAEYCSEPIPQPRGNLTSSPSTNAQNIEAPADGNLLTLLTQNPQNAIAHNNLGLLRFSEGRVDEAVACYEKAIECDPSNPLFQKNLADIYYTTLGKTNEAIDIYAKLLKTHPKDTELLSAMAIISKANQLKEQARVFIKRVLELEPWNTEARDFLAAL
jgi:Flp pilus assembly protein TadD